MEDGFYWVRSNRYGTHIVRVREGVIYFSSFAGSFEGTIDESEFQEFGFTFVCMIQPPAGSP